MRPANLVERIRLVRFRFTGRSRSVSGTYSAKIVTPRKDSNHYHLVNLDLVCWGSKPDALAKGDVAPIGGQSFAGASGLGCRSRPTKSRMTKHWLDSAASWPSADNRSSVTACPAGRAGSGLRLTRGAMPTRLNGKRAARGKGIRSTDELHEAAGHRLQASPTY